ncbi:hypothetical protein Syun_014300 [Stephania yunnanensis]|uniref:Hpc2-related domain-containing protein n=1 Tax=Stephania yunnanensis TaxID=152371 RepID=A0AAP0JL76_9MAGN
MEDERGGAAVASSSFAAAAGLKSRQRFTIELKPGETTIVSWKKLVKEANRSNPSPPPAQELPTGANPALESRIGLAKSIPSEHELNDPAPTHRFSAVIEKIERLYVGNQSSDEEELGDAPDDDQYDTEDSFIDDADLYAHNSAYLQGQETCPVVNVEVEIKLATARSATLGNGLFSQSKNLAAKDGNSNDEHLDASVAHSTKKLVDSNMKVDISSSSKIHTDASMLYSESKDSEKQMSRALSKDVDVVASKVADECSDGAQLGFHDKIASSQLDLQSKRLLNCTKEADVSIKARERETNGRRELPDLNLPTKKYSTHATDTETTHVKKGFTAKPKGAMLQKAIRELEKVVAESRPPSGEVQETDTASQAVKRRLPREVKLKLAKVARLAQSCQGRISEDLINYLMGILGHLVQLKTLKRNLKEMVELGLSAKQEKDDKLQQIKKEVVEMIKIRAPSLRPKVIEHQDGASNDIRQASGSDEKVVLKGRCGMDNMMEDKICDLYDQYVEGMDEDRGPLIRKLYVELAELWPNGTMDNHGIKTAICRAKARKRALHSRLKNQEKIKQQKLSSTPRPQEAIHGEVQQERVVTDSGSQVLTLPNRTASYPTPVTQHQVIASERIPSSSMNDSSLHQPKKQKIKSSPSRFLDEARKAMDRTFLKDKVKWRPGSDAGSAHYHSEKLSLQHGKGKPKSYKRSSDDARRPSPQLPSFQGLKSSPNLRKQSSWVSSIRAGAGGAGTGGLSSFFYSKTGLDSLAFQSQDLSQLSWIGPVPGDIAEVEAYCRIFRSAEHLHTAIMDTLCNPLTGECFVSYDTPSEDVESLEEKVVVVLGCLVSLLNKGREEVLSGRSSFMKSYKTVEVDFLDDKLPPLAAFRREMKRCCESLHIALENYLSPSDSRVLKYGENCKD